MESLIKNGRIINADISRHADLRIKDGIIAEIGKNLIPTDSNTTIIDATNRYVLPGGIDPHVHLHLPTPAGFSSDDFITGSTAALMGGTTTLIDFVTPSKNQSLTQALKNRLEEASGCLTDFSFHVSPVDWHKGIEKEMAMCKSTYGISSFKVYMAYKKVIGLEDDILMKVMKEVAHLGGIVTVHAEMGDEIELLRSKFAESGKTSPRYHALSRPANLETAAIDKAIRLATTANCPLYIVHLSAGSSLKTVIEARKSGANVMVETCPQYLLLDDSKYEGPFEDAATYVLSPPLRTTSDQSVLWQGLADGSIQTVGTDHCPFSIQQKSRGRKDFRLIPNGAGGIEHRMTLLYSEGVRKNRISMQQFVGLTSTNAAKIFSLYPAKGTLAIGSDADIVVWNPETKQIISTATHHQNCDSNIYEGFSVSGKPETVIKSGEIVVEKGSLTKSTKTGNFLMR
jgi:dihydropyrimidinase